MGKTSIFVICILAFIQFSLATQEQITTQPTPAHVLTECGNTIVADNGTIQYKLNEQYDAGELCVFVITFESGYLFSTFVLENEGFSDLDQNAILVSGLVPYPDSEGANLGPGQRNVTIEGVGAVVYFKTNSSEGTGFKLSFWRESIYNGENVPQLNVVFTNESASPLHIPILDYNTSDFLYTNYFITSGSKMISEPGTYFKLTASVVLGTQEPTPCLGFFWVFTFEHENPVFEEIFCNDFEMELRTLGLFIVHHRHHPGTPMVNGTLAWEIVSPP